MPLPIMRPTGNPQMDLFQRQVIEYLKELTEEFNRVRAGRVPPPGGSGFTRFLCEDGTWQVP